MLTNLWNVAGAFLIPKAKTEYWTKSSGVTKAEISEARAVNGTCQYPFRRSNLLTYLAEPTVSMQSSNRGSGNESGIVTEFTLR